MSVLLYKRGDTFRLTADVLDDQGAPVALTGASIACQVRDLLGNLVGTLNIEIDPTIVNRLSLSYAGDTSFWPVGTLHGDIEVTWADASRNTSETFSLAVVDRITSA